MELWVLFWTVLLSVSTYGLVRLAASLRGRP
jgi:hypothetical protein